MGGTMPANTRTFLCIYIYIYIPLCISHLSRQFSVDYWDLNCKSSLQPKKTKHILSLRYVLFFCGSLANSMCKLQEISSSIFNAFSSSYIIARAIPVMIDLIDSRCSTHGLLLCFILLHISNGSVSASPVGHVLYSADLMSATCIPHFHLMVHRYIYSRYSSVFLTLYQLYHSLPSSTSISSSSLYLSVATWVTPQGCNRRT